MHVNSNDVNQSFILEASIYALQYIQYNNSFLRITQV